MPDLRPLRVAQTTSQLLQAQHLKQQPAWLPTVSRIPPSTDLSRKLPPFLSTKRPSRQGKVRRVFDPQPIRYDEDALRRRFYKEHPWELARPVLLVESDCTESRRYDWSKLEQPGKQLSGESVVQRQLHLMTHKKLSVHEAYLQACAEFYKVRSFEAVESRIAMEESMAFGAVFSSQLEVGLDMESRVLATWREKAIAAKSLVQPLAATGPENGDKLPQ